MKASTSTVALGFLLTIAAPDAIALAADPGEQILLERADFWRAQSRFDLVGDMLHKVLAMNPAQPDALYQAGMLAAQQGNGSEAQSYFDRLRQLAAASPRAAELINTLPRNATAPAPMARLPAAPPAAGVAAAPVASAPTAVKPSPPATAPELIVASADSDDLTAAPAAVPAVAPGLATPPTDAVLARGTQVAALPAAAATTLSDTDAAPDQPAAMRTVGSADLGASAKTTQVAQVELVPPPPVGGYQRPIGPAATYSPDDTLEMDIDRSLAQIEAESSPMLVAGFGLRAHGGDEGLNRLTEVGTPIEFSFSPWLTGTARLAILPVWLDAGRVNNGQLFEFGGNPILSATGNALIGSGAQMASGVGILGDYAYGPFSAQLGTSPIGFPVTNMVGNVAYAPKFFGNTLTVKFEATRTPVTDSVLSYAGTRAPLAAANTAAGGGVFNQTYAKWGGVVRTGAHVAAFWDDNLYGAYGGAGLAVLNGTNVPDNGVVDALLGAYFRPYKTDDQAVRVGVALLYMGYDRNLSGFTFGQGGYFSPRNYEALLFPVEWTGHADRWSWLASAAAGVQHFNERSSPLFPTSPGAQAFLQNIAGTGALLPGGTTTSPAFNLKGQLEYAFDNSLSIGVSASLDNGKNYTEGIGKLYMRKTFDWWTSAVTGSDPSIVSRDLPQSRL